MIPDGYALAEDDMKSTDFSPYAKKYPYGWEIRNK